MTEQKTLKEMVDSLSFKEKLKFGFYIPMLLFSNSSVDTSVVVAYNQAKGETKEDVKERKFIKE